MIIRKTSIDVLAWFENGALRPIRFRLSDKEIKIERIVSMTVEKIAGNRILNFRCQSEFSGELRPFEITYEQGTRKWFLWKM